ncbi:MAG: aquaporin [Pirellulales bacterium]
MITTPKAGFAEFLGTFTLVFLGAGAGSLADPGSAGLTAVALTHGIALMFIIYTWGWISGAHVNPAVTLGALLGGKIDFGKAIVYWIAQFAGGIAAAYLLAYLLGPESGLGQTTGKFTDAALAGDSDAKIKVIVVEAILTFFLVASVFSNGLAGKNGNVVGIAIGFVLIADILFGGSLTGASMNPCANLGPRVGEEQHGLRLDVHRRSSVGGGLAGLLYNAIYLVNDEPVVTTRKK